MPIISSQKKLFIHIAKCAGTSIEKHFNINDISQLFSFSPIKFTTLDISKYTGKDKDDILFRTPQHLTAYQLSHLVPNIWNEYEAFTIVRNPYDRLVSEWSYIQNHAISFSRDFKNLNFKDFVFSAFKLPRYTRQIIFDAHLEPQVSFLRHLETGESMVTKVFKFEALEEVFKYLNITSFPHHMKSKHEDYRTYYDKETTDYVYNIYKEDFTAFNYNANLKL